ncbi:MAG TPA: TAXI family TRAP transporter solute-binding subunit [Thermodesulfobacteriota bacterium]|nr:TAXI family TRAP transporter solute-binding subunit [Thermodesulfobacteriota bacterium]
MVKGKGPNRRRSTDGLFHGHLSIIALVLLIVILCGAILFHFVLPAPPNVLVMTTGMEGGTYSVFGRRYQEAMAREKVRLLLLPSSGSVENLNRLKDKSFQVDVGFIQGGTITAKEAPQLVSLGGICYSPLWVFYRGQETFDDLSLLKGKRIAIGPEGSGARKFSMELLSASNVAAPPTQLLDLPSPAAAKAILDGRVDVIMLSSTVDNALVQELLYAKGIKLMNFRQAEAYTRRFPALSQVILPQGILDLSKNNPATDIHLLATTTNLVVRKNLHPAMMYLLLDAAVDIHGDAGWVNRAGEFPSPKSQDFPLSDIAERFYKSGRPFLLDYLPFGMAAYVDRMILILVPAAVVLIPLLRIIPPLYFWWNRRKLYRCYEDLKNLEMEITEYSKPGRTIDYQKTLDRMQGFINEIRVPLALFKEVYTLEEHVNLVRNKLARLGRSKETEKDPG